MMLINTFIRFFWYLLYSIGCNQFHKCVFVKKMCSPDVGNILYMFIRSRLLIMLSDL